jgi:hypothetical protein
MLVLSGEIFVMVDAFEKEEKKSGNEKYEEKCNDG